MRFITLLVSENLFEVPPSVQNTNDTEGVRLNNVEDQDVFETFYTPRSQPGEIGVFKELWRADMRHPADGINRFLNSEKGVAASSAPAST
jgi:hypothetical protein